MLYTSSSQSIISFFIIIVEIISAFILINQNEAIYLIWAGEKKNPQVPYLSKNEHARDRKLEKYRKIRNIRKIKKKTLLILKDLYTVFTFYT